MRTVLAGMALAFAVGSPAFAERLELTVQEASPSFDARTNAPLLNIRLDEASRRAFGEFTTENVGRTIVVYIEDDIVLEPKINEPIIGGHLQVSGEFTVENVNDLAVLLMNGERRISVAPSE